MCAYRNLVLKQDAHIKEASSQGCEAILLCHYSSDDNTYVYESNMISYVLQCNRNSYMSS